LLFDNFYSFQNVSKKGQLRRDSVATKRYAICYNVRVTAKHGIELIGKKVSLPFAILGKLTRNGHDVFDF
jgi:hypothetical protein